MSTIDERDLQVIRLIAQFRQMTASHIRELLFPDSLTTMPCYRSLRRLEQRQLVARIEHRLVGGAGGGSGQYVWTLAPDGARLLSVEYRRQRTVNFHTLEIANTYLKLVELAREGRIRIDHYSTEPDCWRQGVGWELKPDLYVETVDLAGKFVKTFCEVDMGSEGERQLRGKLAAYVYAVDHAEHVEGDWPRTVWVAYDKPRATQLRRIIGQLPSDDQQLFRVCDRTSIADVFV